MEEVLTNEQKTQMVQDAQSVEELINVFEKICPVVGSHKSYSADKLKSKIEQMKVFMTGDHKFDNLPWNLFTRTHGIRAKCMELFMYKKLDI